MADIRRKSQEKVDECVKGIINEGYEDDIKNNESGETTLEIKIDLDEEINNSEKIIGEQVEIVDIERNENENINENESHTITENNIQNETSGSGVVYNTNNNKDTIDIENGNIVLFSTDSYIHSKQMSQSLDSILTNDKDEKEIEIEKTGWRKHGGILFAFLGSITVTLASLTVKVLNDYHPFTLGLYRFVFSTLCTLPFLFYFQCIKKVHLYTAFYPFNVRDRKQWIFVAFLAVFCATNCGGFLFRYFCVQYLTVADGTVLSLSGAVFVVFMAHFCLGEKCGVASLLIAVWTFAGVVIIARPPMITGESEFNERVLIGTMYGIASMIVWSMSVISMRKTRKLHFTTVLLISNIWGTFQCSVLVYIGDVGKILPETLEEGLVLTALVALSYIGSLSLIFAMKYDSAVSYSLIRSGDILFAYFWQFLFLAVIPDSYSIIGAVIVLSGILLSTFKKWITLLPEDSKTKKMFSWLT